MNLNQFLLLLEKLEKQLTRFIKRKPQQIKELKINHLLPDHQKGKIKYTTPYGIDDKDLDFFEQSIDKFIESL